MSVTSGFFNSLNHDRRYNAQQMSAIFDGIINDGVFANIGVAFAITADSGVTINIGVGKAWFNSAWVYNDALLPKTLEGSEVVLDRIDAVVIEVDHNESVRMGDIKIVKGAPSSSPKRPAMANETNKHQHPLAYIYRKAGSTEITQADITNMVGTSECPYITGILQVQNIDNIVAQWNAQWNQWYTEKIAETDTNASELLAEMKSEFDIWFNDIQALLADDVATALAAQVAELQGRFDTLARENAVYDTIEDSDLDLILGSDGTPIQGKTVIGGAIVETEKVELSGYVKREDLDKVEASKLDRTEKYVVNILDNSDFRNPVNQRGFKEWDPTIGVDDSTSSINRDYYGGYTIDRWYRDGRLASQPVGSRSMAAHVILDSNCIRLRSKEIGHIATFYQLIEADKIVQGRDYTMAIKMTDMTIHLASFNVNANTDSSFKITDLISMGFNAESSGMYKFHIDFCDEATLELEWAALYEGTYTVDNLPTYRPKGYGAELAECHRYFYRPNSGTTLLHGVATDTTKFVGMLYTPAVMRVKPSISTNIANVAITAIRGGGKSVSSGAAYITEMTLQMQSGNMVRFNVLIGDATLTAKYMFEMNLTGFELSAEP